MKQDNGLINKKIENGLFEESFSLHNIISFKLINKLDKGGLLRDINPEYDCFKVSKTQDPNFVIEVGKFNPDTKRGLNVKRKYILDKDYLYAKDSNGKCDWSIEMMGLEKAKTKIKFNGNFKGIRKFVKYSALKNIFVRPLITLHLIKKGYALIHSSGISLNGKGYLFVGKAGVFKTTILMEFLRNSDSNYMGEENVIIRGNKAYPFPINIKSFNYKLRYFDGENASSKIQKISLSKHVLFGKGMCKVNISKPCPIKGLFMLKKGDRFSIKKISLTKKVITSLLENEMLEIGMTPTHSLSSVKKNHFDEYINAYLGNYSASYLRNLWKNLEQIFIKVFADVKIYSVVVPKKFNCEIFNKINRLIRNG